MKRLLLSLLLFSVSISSFGLYSWQQLNSMPSYGRAGTIGFAIGSKVYYGLGDFNNLMQFNDLWEYNPMTNAWTQMGDLPGPARVSSTAFSINGYGYVGLGWSEYTNSVAFSDFYKYDPATNTWSLIAGYPGSGSFNACAMVIDSFAYVGIGGSPAFYRYDPVNNNWLVRAAFPGAAIQSTSFFSLNGEGFICGGWDGNSVISEVWSYNPVTNSWFQKMDLPVARGSSIGFSIDGYGFIGMGGTGNFGGTQDVYQYDYLSNTWAASTSFPGLPLAGLRGTTIGNTAYGFGGGDAGIGYYSSELWKFGITTDIINQHPDELTVSYYQNSIHVNTKKVVGDFQFQIYNTAGAKIFSHKITNVVNELPVKLAQGNYIYSLASNSGEHFQSGKIFIY